MSDNESNNNNKINVIDITDRIDQRKEQQRNDEIVKGFEEYLNIDEGGLQNILSSTLGEDIDTSSLAQSISEAAERANMYQNWMKKKEKEDQEQGYDPQQCYCEVCPDHVSSEFTREIEHDDGGYTYERSGRQDYCGKNMAQDCMFRMKEPPINTVSYGEDMPSYSEALNMLARNGLIEPDDFGEYNGTDFFRFANVRTLWFSFCKLLANMVDLDFDNEPKEKTDSINIAKEFMQTELYDFNDFQWQNMEREFKSLFKYIFSKNGIDPDGENSESDINYVMEEVFSAFKGILISLSLREKDI